MCKSTYTLYYLYILKFAVVLNFLKTFVLIKGSTMDYYLPFGVRAVSQFTKRKSS